MARQTEYIQLSKEERRSLKTLFSGGNDSNRKQTRARILDLLAKHTPPPEIARLLSCNLMTVYHIKRRFLAEGVESALSEKPRSGKSRFQSVAQRALVSPSWLTRMHLRDTLAGHCDPSVFSNTLKAKIIGRG